MKRGIRVALGLVVGILAVGCTGSSGSSGSSGSKGGAAACEAYCADFCAALTGCEAPPEDCQARCEAGRAGNGCQSLRPPEQLQCAELGAAFACADYCGTLCERAPSCGASFDSQACAIGCAKSYPPICNAASVAARSCDQLKPELRRYTDRGRAELSGGSSDSGSASNYSDVSVYGLCKAKDDCEEGLGCDVMTNTCAACKTDADCADQYDSYVCNADSVCEKVECLADKDCIIGVCSVELHQCVDCRTDADCNALTPLCDVKTSTCVDCLTDADCKDSFAPHCDQRYGFCSI